MQRERPKWTANEISKDKQSAPWIEALCSARTMDSRFSNVAVSRQRFSGTKSFDDKMNAAGEEKKLASLLFHRRTWTGLLRAIMKALKNSSLLKLHSNGKVLMGDDCGGGKKHCRFTLLMTRVVLMWEVTWVFRKGLRRQRMTEGLGRDPVCGHESDG